MRVLRYILTLTLPALIAATTFIKISDTFAENSPAAVSVEVAIAKIRKEPKHWSAAVGEVPYGTPLTVQSSAQGWLSVQAPGGIQGYLHSSAVTERKIAFAPGSRVADIRPDDSNVVLAGKGFNGEVEGSLRAERAELNFAVVDQIEKQTTGDAALAAFIRTGKLREELPK